MHSVDVMRISDVKHELHDIFRQPTNLGNKFHVKLVKTIIKQIATFGEDKGR